MKKTLIVLAPVICFLTACATTKVPKGPDPTETVMITYRVKPGKEADFKNVLDSAWKIYREKKLVYAQPHVIVQEKEKNGAVRMVEIFTWVSPEASDHAAQSIKALWGQMVGLCEARDGHNGLEGGEVDLLTAKRP